MKKIKYYIYLLLLPLALTSCNQWLDVSPEDEIGEKELFNSGEGYRNALNGVYKAMSEEGLYGRNLTWGINDALGQCYKFGTHSPACDDIYKAGEYDFKNEDLKPKIKTIWEKTYNAVANCNNIIKNIEKADPEIFENKEWEKNMIYGEALALRAFLQFDMLRLFAAAPINKSTKAYIPYITTYPSYISKKLTVNECLGLIIKDLQAAKPLVAEKDTLLDFGVERRLQTVGSGSDQFIESRGYRLNYYAISALLARVYLYAEMKQEAYNEAQALIKVQDSKRYFSFKSASAGGRKLYTDVIAALYIPKLTEWDAIAYDYSVPEDYNWKYLEILDVNTLYDGDIRWDSYEEKYVSNDYRFRYQIQDVFNDGTVYTSMKNQASLSTEKSEEVSGKLLSLIRMSEVYYIAAEVLAETDLEAAKELLFKVKSGRGLRNSRITELREEINSVSKLRAALLNDARREFIAEGQIFFMHKRMGEMLAAPDGVMIPLTDEKVVLPLPDSEISIK